MYGFIATYENMVTEEERTKLIEVDSMFFDKVVDVYAYAMRKAFDGVKENECFSKIEFLYC